MREFLKKTSLVVCGLSILAAVGSFLSNLGSKYSYGTAVENFNQKNHHSSAELFERSRRLKEMGGGLKSRKVRLGSLKSTYLQPLILVSEIELSARLKRGYDFLVAGEAGRAIEEFEAARKSAPESSVINYNLGLSYLILGEISPAERHLQQAAEFSSPLSTIVENFNSSAINYALGIVRYHQQDYSRAILEFQRALAGGFSDPDLRSNLAGSYIRTGRYDLAVQHLKVALRDDPDHPYANYNLACAYSLTGKNEAALDLLRRAIEGDSKLKGSARADADFSNLMSDVDFNRMLR